MSGTGHKPLRRVEATETQRIHGIGLGKDYPRSIDAHQMERGDKSHGKSKTISIYRRDLQHSNLSKWHIQRNTNSMSLIGSTQIESGLNMALSADDGQQVCDNLGLLLWLHLNTTLLELTDSSS